MMDNASAMKIDNHRSKTILHKHIYIRKRHLIHHVRSKSIIIKHTCRDKNHVELMTETIAPANFNAAAATLIHPTPIGQPAQNNHDR